MRPKSITWSRRALLKAGATAIPAAMAPKMMSAADTSHGQPTGFEQRGYYITFMRGTQFTFETWKQILDAVREDGGNLVLLWMAGAFPSRRYPITWRYNAEHENIKRNFAGKLIDYAHSIGLHVLLGLTPFGYDGVNQYALEHPHLKALDRDRKYVSAFGLGAWGFNLNPFLEESQQFMLDYTREMLTFYPNADGLFLESSDYAVSHSESGSENYYDAEFRLVRRISEDVWSRKPDSLIVVYPHYFTGKTVPGIDLPGARQKFDSRWGLFFTPSSAPIEPSLVRQAKVSLYWESSPTHGNPQRIQRAALHARESGLSGFVPSFEPWAYVLQGPDGGDQFWVGHRLAPFGFGWLRPGESPAHELLIRVSRIAIREFAANPGLSFAEYRDVLSRELFGSSASPFVDDLLFLNESFFLDRTWVSVCAIACPDYVKGMLDLGRISPSTLRDYLTRREKLRTLVEKLDRSNQQACVEMRRTARWILAQWDSSAAREYVEAHLA